MCLVAAVLRYRLQEIDGVLRRSLLQVVVVALIATLFLAVAAAVDLATGNSFSAVVAGGLVALALVPLALLLRRVFSQFVYGDRDFPYQVVSELRRLDQRTTPAEALHDMLTLLARRLRLSYASIEVYAPSPEDRIETSIGDLARSADGHRARGRRHHAGSAPARGDAVARVLRPPRPPAPRGHRRAGGRDGAGRDRQP